MAQRQFKNDDSDQSWNNIDRYGNGSDGAGSAGSNVQTSASATIGSTSLTAGSGTGFAAGNLILIHQSRNGGTGVGNWEFNKISSVGAGTNWTLAYTTTFAYDTTAQVYLMKQYSSYSGTLAVGTGWGGTSGGLGGFFCNGAVTITGGTSDGTGFRGGLGVNNQATLGASGEGTGGASVVESSAANGNGGGGGKSTSPESSGGGNGAAGTGSNPGAAVGNVALTVAGFGGGGGGRGMDSPSSNDGVDGGGFILIVGKSITITGATTNNGTNGPTNASGGAGGSVLLKGQSIVLGSALLTATGGTAGSNGGAGGTGRIHADYSKSITGTTSPTIDSTQDNSYFDRGGTLTAFEI